MSNTNVLTRDKVAEAIGSDAMALVSRIDHAEMVHGVHWKWTGAQVFTEEGVKLLVDRLAEMDAGASLALRALAKETFKPVAAPNPPAAHRGMRGTVVTSQSRGRVRPAHSSLDGYVAQET